MIRNPSIVALVGVITLVVSASAAQLYVPPQENALTDPQPVSCSPDKPIVWPRERISVRVWTSPDPSLRYEWTATAGRLEGQGHKVQWDFAGVEQGTYTAAVRVSNEEGEISKCSVEVIVRERARVRPLPRLSGSSYLAHNEREEQGYGLYSYLLFGSRPSEAARERYEKAIEAYLRLIPDIATLEEEESVQRSQLNITYLLVKVEPKKRPSVEWVLKHYDYARALVLLRALGGIYTEGPYFVSTLRPLTGTEVLSGDYIFQDLSSVPAHVVSPWVKEFLNQAAQERFWEKRAARQLVLKLRNIVGILGEGFPDVVASVSSWIAWIR